MDLIKYLKTVDKPIFLYGMGNGADRIFERLDKEKIAVSGVFVSDEFVRDKEFHGHKLCSYSDAKKQYPNMIVLVAFGTCIEEVLDNIKKISCEQELYAPFIPVIGSGDFTDEYYCNHYDDFNFVRQRLADNRSKEVFENIIKYRVSGNTDFLFNSFDSVDNIYSLLNMKKDAVYVDLGAYKGETAAEYIEKVGGYSHIYAVEPDIKNFKKLERNSRHLNNISLYNTAVSFQNQKLHFAMNGGRNSAINPDNDKSVEIQAMSVDEILSGKKADLIKYDVEGAELDAIKGTEETIRNFKPKLAISCYHRIADLFEIPKAVLSIRSDYKLYIRHLSYIPDWDTLYYFL